MVPDVCAGLASCNVFYLAGLLAFPVDQFGLVAAMAAADQSPSVDVAGYAEAYYDTGFARDVIAAALATDPTINTVIASGDRMALGAEQAAAAAGRSVRIVGAGAGASAVAAVRDGRWHAAFNTLPRTEGRLATELLVRALRARPTAPAGVNPVADSPESGRGRDPPAPEVCSIYPGIRGKSCKPRLVVAVGQLRGRRRRPAGHGPAEDDPPQQLGVEGDHHRGDAHQDGSDGG